MKDYKCWLPSEGGTFEDADDCIGCFDAEQAAETFVEGHCVGPDWYGHINGDPIIVMVSDVDGRNMRKFEVHVTTSIDYNADEVTT